MPGDDELMPQGELLLSIFRPEMVEAQLKSNAAEALRELAREIEAGEIKLFRPRLQGNGMMESRYGRVVMDVHFSLEVPLRKRMLVSDDAGVRSRDVPI